MVSWLGRDYQNVDDVGELGLIWVVILLISVIWGRFEWWFY